MTAFLVRRWFLLLLVAGILAGCFVPDAVRPWTAYLHPPTVIGVALFLVAWTMKSRGLARALARPWAAAWAVLLSYTLMPGLAWLAGWLLPAPGLRLGLGLVASVPCTLASAVIWTRRAGGDEAVSLLGIVLATSTGWLATPLCLTLMGAGVGVAIDGVGMMRELLLVLVLPVAAGQLLRAVPRLARATDHYKTPLGVLSQLLVVSIMLKGVVAAHDHLAGEAAAGFGFLLITAAVCGGLHLAGLFLGLVSSRLLGFDRPSQIAVAFGSSQKTMPVALFLFESYLIRVFPLAVVPVVCYQVGQLVLGTFVADRLAAARPPESVREG